MSEIREILPFLIPLVILQFGLLAFALWHVLTHKTYKRGNRIMWVLICVIGMEFVGPILYFVFGKEDA